jgi:hypothetical protein
VKLGAVLAHLGELEAGLAGALRESAERHRADHDVHHQCLTFAVAADKRAGSVRPHVERYHDRGEWASALHGGSDDLLEDLRALHLRAHEVETTWTMVVQAAKATRDEQLLALATELQEQAHWEAEWFTTRIKTSAPQLLIVP